VPAVLLVLTHLVGALGYRLIWAEQGATLLDALFMTFITITTIGFGEVYPLGSAGRLLTMVIAGTGIGSLFYTFTVLLDYASSEQVRAARRRRKMQKTIDDLKGHFILAGIGRVGAKPRPSSRSLACRSWWSTPGRRCLRFARRSSAPTCRGTPPKTRCCSPRASSAPGG
jgi:hypothetical protein